MAKLPKQEHDFEEVAFAQVWPRAIEAFKSENATAEHLDLENKIGQGRAGYRWVVFGGGDLAKLNDAKRVLEEVVPDVNQAKTKKSETLAEACYWLAKTHDIVDSDKIDQGDYVRGFRSCSMRLSTPRPDGSVWRKNAMFHWAISTVFAARADYGIRRSGGKSPTV